MFVKRDTPSPGSDRSKDGGIHCDLCGSSNPAVRCDKCNGHAFCLSCDDMYHRHPKRKQHLRKAIDSYTSTIPASVIRQPSGQRANVPGDPSKMPIPPPRKKKGKSFFPGFGSDIPALPKKEFSLTEKIGSIRRFMSNRPLPPIPKHELPLQQGTIPPKPRAASPKNHQTNNQVILNNQVKHNRSSERQGSPEYQNILAHLTKVAQNSADEWEEEPSVSTSGSTRGSSVGDDIGWGQDVTPLPKSGAPPTLMNPNEELANQNIQEWQGFGTLRRGQIPRGFTPQDRMTHSTSMGNLQSGYPNQQMAGQGFYPSPYPHFYGQGAVPGQAFPGPYPNFVGQFPRGSWSHLQNRGEEEEIDGEEEDPSGQEIDSGTLTKANKTQMKRSQSVMYDPMMAPAGPFFPFGAVPPGYPPGGFFPPGFPPYWSQQPGQRITTPPSPSTSTRSLSRKTRGKSRKHLTDEDTFSSDRSRGGSRRGSRAQHRKSESSDIPPSSEDEGEAPRADKRQSAKHPPEEQKTSEETKDDFPVPEILEDKPPAPPPPIPTEQWECNFCTFINPPGGRVCNVCCKTISSGPETVDVKSKGGEDEEIRSTSPDSKGSKNDLNELKEKKKKAKEEFLNFSPDFIKEQQQLEEEIRKRLERSRRLSEGFPGEPTSRRNSVTETTVLPPEQENTEHAESTTSKTVTAEPSIISPASSPQPPHSKPVSVAETSTSPIRVSPEPSTKDTSTDALSALVFDRLVAIENDVNNIKEKSSTEKATKTDSSCQTNVESNNDTSQLQVHSVALGTDNISDISHEDSLNGPPAKVEMGTSPPNLTEDFSKNMFDKSGNFSNLQRSVSQSSLRDDLLYPGRQYPNERREDYNRGQLLRSLSRTSLVSEPGMYGLQDQLNRAPDSPFIQRKNLGSDWNRRRPSDLAIRDYIPQPQMQGSWYPRDRNSYSSREDLLERRRQETMRVQGLEMVRLIRKAEQSGFLPDDLQVALNHCGSDQDPIDWLEENWINMIETVVTLATNYGHDKPDNDVGIISAGEAKEALRLHRGNIWASVTECVESRQRKYLELRARGNFSRREIVAALTANQGNLELAYSELTRSLHKPFSLNVWGPGSGVENFESARQPPSDVQGKGLFDGFDPLESARSSILQHRKQHLGENTNIHRSMLNLNMIGLEDDFRPLNAPGASPRLARRFSFTSGRTNDFAGFSPSFNRMNQTKTHYDASDSMSMTSEDLETVDTPFKKETAKERIPRETRSNRNKKISRSTTFLNKLASLRKNTPKTQTENQGGVKTEPESDYSESNTRLKRQGKSASVQQLNRNVKEEKPQRRSFLQRMMRGASPDVSKPPQTSENKVIDKLDKQYDDNENKNNIPTLNSHNLQDTHEVSSIEKVQSFLEKMPDDTTAKPEPKMGILQRLGLRNAKKDRDASSSSPVSNTLISLSPNESKESLLAISGAKDQGESSTFYTKLEDTTSINDSPSSSPLNQEKLSNLQEGTNVTLNEKLSSTSLSLNIETQNTTKVESIATARSRFFGITSDNEKNQLNVEIVKVIDETPQPEKEEAKSVTVSSDQSLLEKPKNSVSEKELTDSAKSIEKYEKSLNQDYTEASEISKENLLKNNEETIDQKIPSKASENVLKNVKETIDQNVLSKDSEKALKSNKETIDKKGQSKKSENSLKNSKETIDQKVLSKDSEKASKLSEKSKTPKLSEKTSENLLSKIQGNKTEINSEVVMPTNEREDSKLDNSAHSKLKSVDKKETSLVKPELSTVEQKSPKEERVIRRQVKEELIEEREKTNDSSTEAKNQTKKLVSDGQKPKAEIVQTKLEIVETIVEIVKPRDEKGKLRAEKLVSSPKEVVSTKKIPKETIKPVNLKESKEMLKDTKPTKDKPSEAITSGSTPLAKKPEDISYPVSRFAKPRDPLFAFKNNSQTQLATAGLPSSQAESVEVAEKSTAEKRKDFFSSPPTSPTTGFPLKSILKKPSVTDLAATPESEIQNEIEKSEKINLHSFESDESVAPIIERPNTTDKSRPTIDVNENVNDTSLTPTSTSRYETTSAKAKSISQKDDSEITEINTVVEINHTITQNDAQSIYPSSSIKNTTASKGENDISLNRPRSPITIPNVSDSKEVPKLDATSIEDDTSNNINLEEQKPVRRRRRMSDAEEISYQAPQQSTFPRRRRSMSTDRPSTAIYRTREKKPESFDINDIDLADPELEMALKDENNTKTEANDESNESKNTETDSKLLAPRVRRQRSISRDRLSRTPSATDSGKEGLIGSTSDILKRAKPEALVKQDSFRERRRSMSFDVNKGRFASTTVAKGTKAIEGADSKERSRTPSKSVRQLSPIKTMAKSEIKTKGGGALKTIDTSAPVMSSKRLVLDNKIKDLMSEGKCETYEQAETAARLIEMNFDEEEALEASKECVTLYQAISYLSQDCELCAGKFPVADMVSMVNCTHRACRDCLKAYFTIQIRDRNIMELICPFCNEPDLTNDDIASDYFNHMDLLLKNLLDQDIHELFHRKLRDRVLMKDPLFRWCSQCSSGFIITNPNQKRLLCPDCKAVTCASCRKRWEKQHEGLTCDNYLAWKEANDPEVQAAGLAQHLAENGIDCPNCHFRYSLAKGGCMHFRCVQCQYDFCSGCGKPFKMGQKCGVSEFCSKLGLHAHHPRNCLFYLRDKEPAELQKLLDQFDVAYNTEPPDGMEVKDLCQVNEQKEVLEGLKDDICGKDVMKGYAGLCRVHYIEYLSGLIKKNNLDPINTFNEDELELCLKRATLKLPPRPYGTSAKKYRELLLKTIKDQLPLERIEGM